MDIPIIIVNYNSRKRLEECLRALHKQTLPFSKIVIVDNGSNKDDRNYLLNLSSENRFHVIQLNENVGFAKANNIAFKYLEKYDYVALLNPDAIPNADWLEKLSTAIQKEPDRGAYGSLMLNYNDDTLLDGMGDCFHIGGIAWRKGHGREVNSQNITTKPIFSACAAATCYNMKVIKELGGFDEDFFCYIEDVDFGFRMQMMNYKSELVSDAVVRHVGSDTTKRRSDFSVYYGHRNLEWAYFKNMPLVLLFIFMPIHIFMLGVMLVLFIARKQGKVYCRAKRDAFKELPRVLKQRKTIKRSRSLFSLLREFNYINVYR